MQIETAQMTAQTVPSLFTKFGDAAPARVQFDEKGLPFCVAVDNCTRCGGRGGWSGWPGFTCYRCGGGCKEAAREVRLYTADGVTKLVVRREKSKATKAATAQTAANSAKEAVLGLYGALLDAAKPFCATNEFIASVVAKAFQYGSLSPRQIETLNDAVNRELEKANRPVAAAPVTAFVGTVGQRMVFDLTIGKILRCETQYGSMYMHLMQDAAGNAVVYKGSVVLGDERATIKILATVKDHAEYRGVNQTIVSRPKVQ